MNQLTSLAIDALVGEKIVSAQNDWVELSSGLRLHISDREIPIINVVYHVLANKNKANEDNDSIRTDP